MAINLASIIDVFNEKNLKGLILRTLAEEWPLSARRLHSKIVSRRALSYHAVYKTINQMAKEGILRKEGTNYLINIEWLETTDEAFNEMRKNFRSRKPIYLPSLADIEQEGDTQTFVFENLAEADNYKKKLQAEYLDTKESKKPYIGLAYHIRSPLVYAERSARATGIVSKERIPVFLLIEGNTSVDEWCADYYRSLSIKVRTGMKNCVENCEIMVVGDNIVQIFFPKKLRECIDSIYGKAKNASEISIPEFYSRVYLEKASVKLVITKNKGIAEQIRQNAISQFETGRLAVFSILGTFIDNTLRENIADFLYEKSALDEEAGKKLINLGRKLREGKITHPSYSEKYLDYYSAAVKGKKASDIEKLVKLFIDENITAILFSNAARLMSFTYSYTYTMAITRLPLEFVKGLEPYCIFNYILATTLETENGIFTGKVLHHLNTHKEKETAFMRWAEGKSLRGSLGFGNRYSDLGFLKHMDIPIAIDPDEKLRKHAKAHKWKIYGKKDLRMAVDCVRGILDPRGG